MRANKAGEAIEMNVADDPAASTQMNEVLE